GSRGERVRRVADQIAPPVAIEVDSVFVIDARHELELANLSGPRATHFRRGEIAALDHSQRVEQLLLELVGTAAIEGERGEGAKRLHVAHHLAKIRLEPPEANENRTRHAVLLLDPGEGRRVLLQQRRADTKPVCRHHTAGELKEALRKYRLPAILGDHRWIVGQAV